MPHHIEPNNSSDYQSESTASSYESSSSSVLNSENNYSNCQDSYPIVNWTDVTVEGTWFRQGVFGRENMKPKLIISKHKPIIIVNTMTTMQQQKHVTFCDKTSFRTFRADIAAACC